MKNMFDHNLSTRIRRKHAPSRTFCALYTRCKKDELSWDTKVYIDQTTAIHFSRQARQDSWPRQFFKFGFDGGTPGTFYDCILTALETTRLAHSVLESELVRFFFFLFSFSCSCSLLRIY